MDIVISSVKCQSVLLHLDDIFILSKSLDDHSNPLRPVLNLLTTQVSKGIEKCEFFTNCINYLAFHIKTVCLELSSHTIDEIKGLQVPSIIMKKHFFYGLSMIFCLFVPNFARIVPSFNCNFRIDEHCTYPEYLGDELVALHTQRDKLLRPSVLALPRLQETYAVDNDACNGQFGGVLPQEQPDGDSMVIGHWS